ncbi:metal ABC transporter ATP-binding protein [Microcella humidisoli]|uniref:Metal ABC transporter ATP-binding protein n=1 Tax=Microcella humidisoli TaxID=2963406 RepID=A0ABY5FZA2_9MICO|nr:metal ABC transporter ATP-binding protein [Microcella humidisoli]UTT63461.1 metal ABC transporter ATP-binding protein [Microcella humidisoli]
MTTDPTAGRPAATPSPVLSIRGGALRVRNRELWSGLDLDVHPGEFIAVLGGNGTGKTSLLRAMLGERRLDEGTVQVGGHAAHRGHRRIGYIPQQKIAAPGTPLRGRDLVALGVNGTRWGPPISTRGDRERVDALLASVGAESYADRPLGSLSGGEQQRLRVAQALADDPTLLLCDEPLMSLDLQHQRAVSELIDARRREHGTAVVFVTHDINPVLAIVDRVLYLAQGRFTIGTPDEVLRDDVLSRLYGTPVEVFRSRGRVIVVGTPEAEHHHEVVA